MSRTTELFVDRQPDHNPGTLDDEVSPGRRAGRRAYRLTDGKHPTSPLRKKHRYDWWSGWYDEQLRRFFGR